MKLVASMICRNELGRYLTQSVPALLEYVDEVRVLDDGSTDGSGDYLRSLDRVAVSDNSGQSFNEHEGRARNTLLGWTFAARPTHVLAIDADEFLTDGPLLRARLEADTRAPVWKLCMEEVWDADADALAIREDGAWCPHPVPICYRAPQGPLLDASWQIANRQLACGREPAAARHASRLPTVDPQTVTDILHFGWTNRAERQARYDRYVSIDGGRFHSNRHLQSIMWPDERVATCEVAWSERLVVRREEILVAAGR